MAYLFFYILSITAVYWLYEDLGRNKGDYSLEEGLYRTAQIALNAVIVGLLVAAAALFSGIHTATANLLALWYVVSSSSVLLHAYDREIYRFSLKLKSKWDHRKDLGWVFEHDLKVLLAIFPLSLYSFIAWMLS